MDVCLPLSTHTTEFPAPTRSSYANRVYRFCGFAPAASMISRSNFAASTGTRWVQPILSERHDAITLDGD